MRLSHITLRRRPLLLLALASLMVVSGCAGGKTSLTPYPGSASATGGPTPAGQEDGVAARQSLKPTLTWINERIASYEKKNQDWQQLSSRTVLLNLGAARIQELSACRLEATDLLAGYNQLHDRLLRAKASGSGGSLPSSTLVGLQQRDIKYLDGKCSQLLAEVDSSLSGGMVANMAALESEMAAALADNDFATVISRYQSLALPPGVQPSFGITYTYGLALLKSGREQDGRMVFSDLLSRTRSQGAAREEGKLLALLGDLDFGLGDYRSARGFYQDLERLDTRLGEDSAQVRRKLAMLDSADMHSLEVRAYGALLLGSLTYNPDRDGFTLARKAEDFLRQYPMSMVAADVTDLAARASDEAEKWFGGLLSQVDALTAEQKNQEALNLLQRVPRDILPLDKQAILKLKIDTLAASVPSTMPGRSGVVEEEIIQTTVPGSTEQMNGPGPATGETAAAEGDGHVDLTGLQKTWDEGVAQMQAKEYDAAIVTFSGLLNTSMGDKARVQVAEASRLAAQENRKKAADLFVRATHATSDQARRELLLSSRRLLEDILQKYPNSGLEDKVKRNLNRIDQELAALGDSGVSGPTGFNGQ